jgi:prefoldin alpha subunit
MSDKEDMQKKIMEFQILDSNLKMLQERAEIFNERMEDLQRSKAALEEMKTTKPEKALIPVGSGNFVFGSIENCADVIYGIGSGIAMKGNIEDALKNIDGRAKEIEKSLNEIIKQITIFVSQLEKTQREIESLQR